MKNMEICAKLSYLRIAPRKVRLLADLVRGKKAQEAQAILSFLPNKSAGVILKLLKQAVAAAKNNFKIGEDNLYISKIIVDAGPMLKRFRPRARGSAYEIQKKTSHIIITLEEIEKGLGKENIDVEEQEIPEKETSKRKETEAKAVKKPEKEIIKKSSVLKPQIQKPQTKLFRRQTF